MEQSTTTVKSPSRTPKASKSLEPAIPEENGHAPQSKSPSRTPKASKAGESEIAEAKASRQTSSTHLSRNSSKASPRISKSPKSLSSMRKSESGHEQLSKLGQSPQARSVDDSRMLYPACAAKPAYASSTPGAAEPSAAAPAARKLAASTRKPVFDLDTATGTAERKINAIQKERLARDTPCCCADLEDEGRPPAGATGSDSPENDTCLNGGTLSLVAMPRIMFPAPDFKSTAVHKQNFFDVQLSDYRGKYLCLFFYPMDFTFVCPTEITAMSALSEDFKEANCSILGCSCDSQFCHLAYIKTPRQNNGVGEISFPLMSDYTKVISCTYNVLTPEGISQRALFIIDPVGIIRYIAINDAGVGRNTDEVLRMVRAIKTVDDFDEMCPDGWLPGAATVVPTHQGAVEYYRQKYGGHRTEDDVADDVCMSDHFSVNEGNGILL